MSGPYFFRAADVIRAKAGKDKDMQVREIAVKAAGQLSSTLGELREDQLQELIKAIAEAKKVYVAGAGRSMLMLRCLAMRLMHVGIESYVVGDTTTPAFEKGDLLITASGSGETSYTVGMAKKAKALGGKVAAITIRQKSTLGKLADLLVEVDASSDKVQDEHQKKAVLPGGSLFEQSVLLIGDALVIPLAEYTHTPLDHAFSRHANLE